MERPRLIQFINSDFLSDVSIRAGSDSFPAHKVVLAAGSQFFYDAFKADPAVAAVDLPEVTQPFRQQLEAKAVLPSVLKFLYADQATDVLTSEILNPQSAMPLYALSHAFKVDSLTNFLCEYLVQNVVTSQNAATCLLDGLRFKSEPLIQASKETVLNCFEDLADRPVLIHLHYDTFLELIQDDKLNVHSESSVLELVLEYLKRREPQAEQAEAGFTPLEELQKYELLKAVRWGFLKHNVLLEASTNPLLRAAKDMVIEGLSSQLSSLDATQHVYEINRNPRTQHAEPSFYRQPGPAVGHSALSPPESRMRIHDEEDFQWAVNVMKSSMPNSSPKPPQRMSPARADRLQQNSELPREFIYTYDFDENGALYFLSTFGKTQSWQNPHLAGQVQVFCSSIGYGRPEDFVGRAATNLRTGNEPFSYIGVDLSPGRLLVPTAYTLRNRNSSSHVCFNWQLEASVDKVDWVVIDRRIHLSGDPVFDQEVAEERKMLKQAGATSTWGISTELTRSFASKMGGFRYFRILQIDKNSSGSNNLAISGFELYGTPTAGRWP